MSAMIATGGQYVPDDSNASVTAFLRKALALVYLSFPAALLGQEFDMDASTLWRVLGLGSLKNVPEHVQRNLFPLILGIPHAPPQRLIDLPQRFDGAFSRVMEKVRSFLFVNTQALIL